MRSILKMFLKRSKGPCSPRKKPSVSLVGFLVAKVVVIVTNYICWVIGYNYMTNPWKLVEIRPLNRAPTYDHDRYELPFSPPRLVQITPLKINILNPKMEVDGRCFSISTG